LVGTEQEAEPYGLRAAAGELRSLYLRGDEPPDGEKIGPMMSDFGALARPRVAPGITKKQTATYHFFDNITIR
jgi:hypothetical protein